MLAEGEVEQRVTSLSRSVIDVMYNKSNVVITEE